MPNDNYTKVIDHYLKQDDNREVIVKLKGRGYAIIRPDDGEFGLTLVASDVKLMGRNFFVACPHNGTGLRGRFYFTQENNRGLLKCKLTSNDRRTLIVPTGFTFFVV